MKIAALLLAVAACSSDDSSAGPVTGTVGDQPFVARSAGMFIEHNGNGHILITDFDDVCASVARGHQPSSATVEVYLPTSTPAIGDTFVTDLGPSDASGTHGSVVFARIDDACQLVTDDHADQGDVTITATAATGLTATLDSSSNGASAASGTFTVGCMIESFGDDCLP